MRAIIFSIAILTSVHTFSQGTSGQIAHWDMNGTANDVSGNGHDGHMVNVTPAVGQDGVMGHAYYFNGVNSMITVPYSPAFNITKYSICATVKVLAFYSGTCDANMIFTRGKTGTGTGTYTLNYSDMPTNSGCTVFDSSLEVFVSGTGDRPSSASDFSYTPNIAKYVWYKIVATFNDTIYKTHVNDTLKSSSIAYSPGPINSSTDSISIGYNIFEPSYPYALNGYIDDIRLYDRVLSDSEIHVYSTGAGTTSVENTKSQQPVVALFPNPAKEKITIELLSASNATVKIFDVYGRIVAEQELVQGANSIDIQKLTSGMYFANVFCENEITSLKFVKQE